MKEYSREDFQLNIDSNDPLFVISVVSEMVNIPIWTLRKLDDMGVVEPKRLGKKTRCYTMNQIRTLQYVHHLLNERRVNISGIKIILELQE